MYARVVTVQLKAGQAEAANQIVAQSILPVVKELSGFGGQLFFTDPEIGKAVSVNLWETEHDMKAFESSPLYQELMGKLMGVLAGRPAVETYHAGVVELSHQPTTNI